MKYELFVELYKEAEDTESLDSYIMERGWQEWMEGYTSNKDSQIAVDASGVVEILTKIYNLAKSDMRGIRQMTGKSMRGFATAYRIPQRTLQDWEYGNSKIPEYTKTLIAYTVLEKK